MSSNFRYQLFVAVCRDLGVKLPVIGAVLSSHEHETYSATSLVENCIEFQFRLDGKYYVDLGRMYLALKLKQVKGRGRKSHNTRKLEKEYKEKAKTEEQFKMEEAQVPLVNWLTL